MQLPPSFRVLLQHSRPSFTAPSFRLFVLILTGWALSCRHRFITECIFTAGQVGVGHWSCFHRFFSHYAWSLDELCQVLARLLVRRFCPEGPLLLAADDTLCRKRGLGLFGAGMHHDPLFSSKALKVFSWGHDWVVVALLVRGPRCAPTTGFALPFLLRLYVNRQGVAKGKKAKPAKKRRAAGRTWGPGRKKGEPLPDLAAWANASAQPWQRLEFDEFGLHATLQIKVQQALYYTAGKDRLLTILLTRDLTGQRPDHRFYCT